ncbi:E3 ORF1 [Bottlenose dolphin adenovirus 1]|uniref:E3 ORF1 n=1 Tax=Bottlenose dolphin adenovirus 1 TaxID=1714377 RepID=A0A1X7MMY5_9ADEN|nr:E3 ORF1 [Bottlenose dolphin adenovirus 1]SMG83457.1 E3 ORF1 [Bottlenose dolphin adenovirus 1]
MLNTAQTLVASQKMAAALSGSAFCPPILKENAFLIPFNPGTELELKSQLSATRNLPPLLATDISVFPILGVAPSRLFAPVPCLVFILTFFACFANATTNVYENSSNPLEFNYRNNDFVLRIIGSATGNFGLDLTSKTANFSFEIKSNYCKENQKIYQILKIFKYLSYLLIFIATTLIKDKSMKWYFLIGLVFSLIHLTNASNTTTAFPPEDNSELILKLYNYVSHPALMIACLAITLFIGAVITMEICRLRVLTKKAKYKLEKSTYTSFIKDPLLTLTAASSLPTTEASELTDGIKQDFIITIGIWIFYYILLLILIAYFFYYLYLKYKHHKQKEEEKLEVVRTASFSKFLVPLIFLGCVNCTFAQNTTTDVSTPPEFYSNITSIVAVLIAFGIIGLVLFITGFIIIYLINKIERNMDNEETSERELPLPALPNSSLEDLPIYTSRPPSYRSAVNNVQISNPVPLTPPPRYCSRLIRTASYNAAMNSPLSTLYIALCCCVIPLEATEVINFKSTNLNELLPTDVLLTWYEMSYIFYCIGFLISCILGFTLIVYILKLLGADDFHYLMINDDEREVARLVNTVISPKLLLVFCALTLPGSYAQCSGRQSTFKLSTNYSVNLNEFKNFTFFTNLTNPISEGLTLTQASHTYPQCRTTINNCSCADYTLQCNNNTFNLYNLNCSKDVTFSVFGTSNNGCSGSNYFHINVKSKSKKLASSNFLNFLIILFTLKDNRIMFLNLLNSIPVVNAFELSTYKQWLNAVNTLPYIILTIMAMALIIWFIIFLILHKKVFDLRRRITGNYNHALISLIGCCILPSAEANQTLTFPIYLYTDKNNFINSILMYFIIAAAVTSGIIILILAILWCKDKKADKQSRAKIHSKPIYLALIFMFCFCSANASYTGEKHFYVKNNQNVTFYPENIRTNVSFYSQNLYYGKTNIGGVTTDHTGKLKTYSLNDSFPLFFNLSNCSITLINFTEKFVGKYVLLTKTKKMSETSKLQFFLNTYTNSTSCIVPVSNESLNPIFYSSSIDCPTSNCKTLLIISIVIGFLTNLAFIAIITCCGIKNCELRKKTNAPRTRFSKHLLGITLLCLITATHAQSSKRSEKTEYVELNGNFTFDSFSKNDNISLSTTNTTLASYINHALHINHSNIIFNNNSFTYAFMLVNFTNTSVDTYFVLLNKSNEIINNTYHLKLLNTADCSSNDTIIYSDEESSDSFFIIVIIIVALILIIGLSIGLYCAYKKRCNKNQSPYPVVKYTNCSHTPPPTPHPGRKNLVGLTVLSLCGTTEASFMTNATFVSCGFVNIYFILVVLGICLIGLGITMLCFKYGPKNLQFRLVSVITVLIFAACIGLKLSNSNQLTKIILQAPVQKITAYSGSTVLLRCDHPQAIWCYSPPDNSNKSCTIIDPSHYDKNGNLRFNANKASEGLYICYLAIPVRSYKLDISYCKYASQPHSPYKASSL